VSTTLTRPGQPATKASWPSDLARAAAVPVGCAVVLTGLLVAWVASGGAGTIHRVRMQVSQASIPARGYTASSAAAVHSAGLYLTIRNRTGQPDQLTAVSSPAARQIELTERQIVGGPRTVVRELTVPAHGTLRLTPFGDDVILENPVAYETRSSVPLVLTFRHTGKLSVDAAVSAPGTP
jgi:copper(I)-binding protein